MKSIYGRKGLSADLGAKKFPGMFLVDYIFQDLEGWLAWINSNLF